MKEIIRRVRWFATAVVFLPWCFGCGGARTEAKAPEETRNNETEQAAEEQVDPYLLCDAIRRDEELPIHCEFGDLGGAPGMVLVVRDADALEAYLPELSQLVVAPFCASQNQLGQRAYVIFSIANERIRSLDCRTRELSDWRTPEREEETVVTVGQACSAIQESELPLGCGLGFIGGVESLVVSYSSGQGGEQLLPRVGQVVAEPFCLAAQENGTEAAVYLIEDSSRASRFDCLRQEWTPWVSVRPVVHEEEPSAPSPGSAPRPRPGSGRPDRTARVEYELLNMSQ